MCFYFIFFIYFVDFSKKGKEKIVKHSRGAKRNTLLGKAKKDTSQVLACTYFYSEVCVFVKMIQVTKMCECVK